MIIVNSGAYLSILCILCICYMCILHLIHGNVIFGILESHAFKKYSTCWVFQALCICVFAYLCIFVFYIWYTRMSYLISLNPMLLKNIAHLGTVWITETTFFSRVGFAHSNVELTWHPNISFKQYTYYALLMIMGLHLCWCLEGGRFVYSGIPQPTSNLSNKHHHHYLGHFEVQYDLSLSSSCFWSLCFCVGLWDSDGGVNPSHGTTAD